MSFDSADAERVSTGNASDPDDYSLIVDGTAVVASSGAGPRLLVTPTRAVLHRAGAGPTVAASSCGSDCVPLDGAKR